ncbi:MAG: DJ-1 family glyoxalase III [Mangrovibacterium sp.]
MKKIAVHLATGFEEIEAITIIDVLRRAGFKVTMVSVTGEKLVVGSHQIPVLADKLFDEVNYDEMDMILLPGGMPGAKNLDLHEGLKAQIIQFNQQQKPLGAICAAPLVLGHLQLLNGKRAVCYPGFENELTGALVNEEPAVVDKNIITGRGVGAALTFALKIVEMLDSKQKADQLAKAMLVENWR